MAQYRVLLSEIRCDEGEDNTATLVSYDVSADVHELLTRELGDTAETLSTLLITDVDAAVRHADSFDAGVFI